MDGPYVKRRGQIGQRRVSEEDLCLLMKLVFTQSCVVALETTVSRHRSSRNSNSLSWMLMFLRLQIIWLKTCIHAVLSGSVGRYWEYQCISISSVFSNLFKP